MDFTLRKFIVLLSFFAVLYVGWRCGLYFFSTSKPHIEVAGLVEGNYYGGKVPCVINVQSRYKLQSVRIWLDDNQILPENNKRSSSYSQPITINTKGLLSGLHTIKVEAVDATRNNNKELCVVNFGADNLPLQAAFARPVSDFKVLQGRVFHAPLQVNKPIKRAVLTVFSREFVAVQESERATVYECFVPIECEDKPGDYPFTMTVEDFVGNKTELSGTMQIVLAPFKRQVLHHIDTSKFEEERKLGRPERDLSDLLAQVAVSSPKTKLWRGMFYAPLNSHWVACEFGAKRISQERGCYTHAAIDLVGSMPHTVVWAPQDGVIAIKDRFEVTGNTVVIDHGCGVISLLCHLDQFADIKVGDKIRRGRPVGVTGKTGYATGDHLHWEMRVNNIQVDPLQWTKADF
jgi:hypothetical protein